MYNNVTEAFKETIRSPSRTFEARLRINGNGIIPDLKSWATRRPAQQMKHYS